MDAAILLMTLHVCVSLSFFKKCINKEWDIIAF